MEQVLPRWGSPPSWAPPAMPLRPRPPTPGTAGRGRLVWEWIPRWAYPLCSTEGQRDGFAVSKLMLNSLVTNWKVRTSRRLNNETVMGHFGFKFLFTPQRSKITKKSIQQWTTHCLDFTCSCSYTPTNINASVNIACQCHYKLCSNCFSWSVNAPMPELKCCNNPVYLQELLQGQPQQDAISISAVLPSEWLSHVSCYKLNVGSYSHFFFWKTH